MNKLKYEKKVLLHLIDKRVAELEERDRKVQAEYQKKFAEWKRTAVKRFAAAVKSTKFGDHYIHVSNGEPSFSQPPYPTEKNGNHIKSLKEIRTKLSLCADERISIPSGSDAFRYIFN